jgi:putative DNA primase/helicase
MSPDADLTSLTEPIARRLLGDPNPHLSTKTELRFGTHGSMAVVIAGPKRGTWYDHEAGEGGGVLDLVRIRKQFANGEELDWLRAEGLLPPRPAPKGGQIVAEYDYHAANGTLLFQVVRKVPKAFVQRRPDGNGGWIWNMHGIERVPYRLPELRRAAADARIYTCEGEKDCDALHERGLTATTNPGGAGKWQPSMSAYLRDCDVVILPDNDPAGEQHAQDVARKLHGVARAIRVVRLPGLPDKGDVSDWLATGGTADELERLITQAPIYQPDKAPAKSTIIVEPGQLDVLATMAEDALIAAKLPVFQRGGMLVRPAAWEVPASDERTTLAAGLQQIKPAALIDLLAQAAIWMRYNWRRKQYCPIDPPSTVAAVLLSRAGSWRVPGVIGTITTPTLHRDGSILSDAGYDPATRLYHCVDPELHMPPIGTSRAEAERALILLHDLLTGFPFVSDTDRAVALSGLISPCVRGAVGMVPLHAMTAPTAGTGKSYLVDLASAIVTGRICPVATAGRNEEETEKRLGGLLLSGFAVITLDNMSDALGGDLLCQAVERPIIRLRPLGRSEIVEIESRATIFATGNNLIATPDSGNYIP